MLPIPEAIQLILENYVSQLTDHVPNLDYSFYIVGSIALGEFNEHFSDIDFVTVLPRGLSPGELKGLETFHQDLEKNYRWKLSGSYIQTEDLGKIDGFSHSHPRYHDRVLDQNGDDDLNLVTWWELKNHGITVIGVPSQELPFTVDWDLLILRMRENLNSYWANWTRLPTQILMLYSDWGIQWAVTGVLRQFYTFRENSITTKIKATRYALGCLPDRWHPLLQEAINIREGKKGSLYKSKISRARDAVRFLKDIIQICNDGF